jgi:hypothetical protein
MCMHSPTDSTAALEASPRSNRKNTGNLSSIEELSLVRSNQPPIASIPAILHRHTLPPYGLNSRSIIKTICVATLPLELLFMVFSANNGVTTAQNLQKDFTPYKNINDEMLGTYYVIAYILSNMDLYANVLCVSPAFDADNLYIAFTRGSAKEKNDAKIKLATRSLIVLSAALSFTWGALADSIPVADFFNKHISNKTVVDVLNYGFNVPIVAPLGIAYYTMFNYEKFYNHFAALAKLYNKPGKHFRFMLSNPSASFEIILISLFNAIYRAISFGFIATDVFQSVFRSSPTSPTANLFMWMAIVETFGMTVFSRILGTKNMILKKNFQHLTDAEVNAASRFGAGTALDLLLSAARGIGFGALVGLFFQDYTPGFISGYSVGALFFTHAMKVRMDVRQQDNAIANIPEAEFKARITAAEEIKKAKKEQKKRRAAEGALSEHTPLKIDDPAIEAEIKHLAQLKEMFLELCNTVELPFLLVWVNHIMNAFARIFRGLNLYSFSKDVTKHTHINISNEQNAALILTGGLQTGLNDFPVFGGDIETTEKTLRISYLLHEQRSRAEGKTGSKTKVKNLWMSFWNGSPYNFSTEELQQLHRRRKPDITLSAEMGEVSGNGHAPVFSVS